MAYHGRSRGQRVLRIHGRRLIPSYSAGGPGVRYPHDVNQRTNRSKVTAGTRVSLRHVAQLAGVSVATASRVMSESSHPVSDGTRDRVRRAAESLGFEPNRLARALVTARSQTIGVIVHDISDPYFGDIVKGLEDGIHASDYRLFVASSERDPERELNYVRAFQAQQVDALVFAASGLNDPVYERQLSALVERYRRGGGVAVVLSDHTLAGPTVRFENHRALTDMVAYLAGQGHRRIAYITGPPELAVCDVRLGGYHAAVAELGLDADETLVEDGQFTLKGGGEAVATLLERTDFTAVLAANDLMAIGATRGLVSRGVAVPASVSVAGLDDIAIAEYGPVPLTTMRLPTYELGQRGASLLLRVLAGGDPDDETIRGEIIERDSVGPAPR